MKSLATKAATIRYSGREDASLADRIVSDGTAAEIIASTLSQASRPVISTNFRPGAAALLHLVTRAVPDIPVIWVDTGFNTPATYRFVETLRLAWDLNLHAYTPRVSASRFSAVVGDIPLPNTTEFESFVGDAKLEPFQRALRELRPDAWFTGIRREQTEHRRTLGVVSAGPQATVRVAPLYDWSVAQIDSYIEAHDIPDNKDYVDPTKPAAHLECGLQQLA